MKPFPRLNILILLGAPALLSGCETISSWFPDKQKQYQYSTEIPPLEIPPDLSSSTIEGAAARRRTATIEDTGLPASRDTLGESAAMPPAGETPESSAETARSAAADRPSKTEAVPTLAQNSDNAPLMEIEAPFEIAWAEVAKALGRMELEISDQNRSDGLYYVYFGGASKPYEDRGFLGDLAEIFGGDQEKAKEYRIKLEGMGKVTTVRVFDSDNRPQMEGPGLELLKRLHETLQAMATPGKDEKSSAETTPESR